MDSSKPELSEIVAFMKREKVATLHMGGLKVELHASAFEQAPNPTETKPDASAIEPTDEDFLFWSVDGVFEEPQKGIN